MQHSTTIFTYIIDIKKFDFKTEKLTKSSVVYQSNSRDCDTTIEAFVKEVFAPNCDIKTRRAKTNGVTFIANFVCEEQFSMPLADFVASATIKPNTRKYADDEIKARFENFNK